MKPTTTPQMQLDAALQEVVNAIANMDWDALSGEVAVEVLSRCSSGVSVLQSGVTFAAHRAKETNMHHESRLDAPSFVAKEVGCTRSEAVRTLKLGKELRELPDLVERFSSGLLHHERVRDLADAITVNPADAEHLKQIAQTDTAKVLKDECSKSKHRVAKPKDVKDAELRRGFHWTRVDEFGWRPGGYFTNRMKAELDSAMEPVAKRLWEEARRNGAVPESVSAYDADAVVLLARAHYVNKRRAAGDQLPATDLVGRPVRIGITAIVDTNAGTVDSRNAGPLSLPWLEARVQRASLRPVYVGSGEDPQAHTDKKDIEAAVLDAVLRRTKRCCIEGCDRRYGLELDHRDERSRDGGRGNPSNLNWLCREHHRIKTIEGLILSGKPGHMHLGKRRPALPADWFVFRVAA